MNVYALLKKDHQEAKSLMKKLDESTERAVKTREKVFAELQSALELHMYLEETLFYPRLKAKMKSEEIALEGYEEHSVVKNLLIELNDLAKDREEWGPKFTVLKENIEHHVEEEEGEMFTKAKQVLSDEEAEEIGSDMATQKAEMMATKG